MQKAAEMLYKAALRAELSTRLEVAWGEIDGNGGAGIVGVPDSLIREFSKRRAQVEATAARLVGEKEATLCHLGRSLTGDERAAVFQLAAYQSRDAIIGGLRQAQAHSYDNALRRQAKRHMQAFPDHNSLHAITIDGPTCEPDR